MNWKGFEFQKPLDNVKKKELFVSPKILRCYAKKSLLRQKWVVRVRQFTRSSSNVTTEKNTGVILNKMWGFSKLNPEITS